MAVTNFACGNQSASSCHRQPGYVPTPATPLPRRCDTAVQRDLRSAAGTDNHRETTRQKRLPSIHTGDRAVCIITPPPAPVAVMQDHASKQLTRSARPVNIFTRPVTSDSVRDPYSRRVPVSPVAFFRIVNQPKIICNVCWIVKTHASVRFWNNSRPHYWSAITSILVPPKSIPIRILSLLLWIYALSFIPLIMWLGGSGLTIRISARRHWEATRQDPLSWQDAILTARNDRC